MYKQKIIFKYAMLFIMISIIVVSGYFYIRAINYSSVQEAEFNEGEAYPSFDDVQPVASYSIDNTSKLKSYSDNIFVHIINGVIPSAKVGYESSSGVRLPGFISSAVGNIAKISDFDITNPKTYFRFVLVAFSQYDPTTTASAYVNEPNKLPDITDFKDAPEGAIYFSEYDEYLAENNPGESIAVVDVTEGNDPNTQVEQSVELNIGDPKKIALTRKSPEILIYHTHATESYMPITTGNSHTLDEKYNVISVGNVMTDVLQKKYEYKVIHDKTYHDKESYAYSYTNSLLTIKEQLKRNDSLKVLLDVHRDAFPTETSQEDLNQKKKDYTVKINGKNAARIMLVIGKDNPNYEELEKFAVYIKKKMDKLYPGLFLKIDRKAKAKYNQYYSDYSMLLEIGCNVNTYEEAKYSAELMANVIGEVLKDLKE